MALNLNNITILTPATELKVITGSNRHTHSKLELDKGKLKSPSILKI